MKSLIITILVLFVLVSCISQGMVMSYPASGAPAPCTDDQQFNYVSTLLHMDGVDDATTFTDDSYNGFTVTANGQANTETTDVTPQFGTASAYFDGDGDELEIAHNAALSFGASDFTVEFWFRPSTITGGDYILFYKSHGEHEFSIAQNGSTIITYISSNGTGFDIKNGATIATGLSANQWYHFAMTRNGSTWKTFLGGTETNSFISTSTIYDEAGPASIGGHASSTTDFNGYIDDLRITKGVGRSITASPTAAYPDEPCYTEILQDELVLSFDPSQDAYSGTIADISINSNTGTFGGNTTDLGTSLEFDGTTDDVDVAESTSYDFGTGDFSFQAYVNMDVASNSDMIYHDSRAGISTNRGHFARIESNNTIKFLVRANTEVNTLSTKTLSIDTWYHIVGTKTANDIDIFVDGLLDKNNSSPPAGTVTNATYPMRLGLRHDANADDFDGEIAQFQFYSRQLTPNEAAYNFDIQTGWTPTTALLLDDYGANSEVAYSVSRKLDKDYLGPAMEIERTSDNATKDIYFIGIHTDDRSIESFCSGTTCGVRTLYDQDGTANNATQTTYANMPTIYTGGAVVRQDGRVAMDFDHVNDNMALGSGITFVNSHTMAAVFERVGTADEIYLLSSDAGSGNAGNFVYAWLTDNNFYSIGTADYRKSSATSTDVGQQIMYGNYNDAALYRNNSSVAMGSPISLTHGQALNYIGRRWNGSATLYTEGKQQEIIYWTASKSADRAAIYTDQDSYYRP